MQFNYRDLLEFIGISFYRSFFFYKLSFKRLFLLFYFYLILPIWQIPVWIGLTLDKVFYPDFMQVKVKEPIFIIGNPRSGTTFLHRLLSKDTDNFTSMKTWEIFMAPSILGRKIIKIAVKIDGIIKNPGIKLLRILDNYIQNNKYSKLHRTPIWETEEDDNLLIHIWSNIKLFLAIGVFKNIKKYIYFDQRMPLKDRKRIINFYKNCVKRHIYFHKAQEKHYLSKSPYFTPKVVSLLKSFPDAKIIYLVRNPMEMVPSYINLLNAAWESTGGDNKDFNSNEYVLDLAKHWYNYPLEKLKGLSKNRFIIVKTEELAKNPIYEIKNIYKNFNLGVNEKFDRLLLEIHNNSKDYKSSRTYSYKKLGLSKKYMRKFFNKVFKKFGYSV